MYNGKNTTLVNWYDSKLRNRGSVQPLGRENDEIYSMFRRQSPTIMKMQRTSQSITKAREAEMSRPMLDSLANNEFVGK